MDLDQKLIEAYALPYAQMDLSAIEPVPPSKVKTPKDFDRETKAIVEMLSNKKNDWQKRLKCIQFAQQCFVTPEILGNFQIAQFLVKIREPLTQQLFDLRVGIAREACMTFALISEVLLTEFEGMAAKLFVTDSPLFKLMESGNRQMADSAHNCVTTILYNTGSIKILKSVFHHASSRHLVIRSHCVQYMIHILILFPISTLSKFTSEISQFVKQVIADPNPQVRKKARGLFIKFQTLYPEISHQMFASSIDISYKKAIFDEYLALGLNPAETGLFPHKDLVESQEDNGFFLQDSQSTELLNYSKDTSNALDFKNALQDTTILSSPDGEDPTPTSGEFYVPKLGKLLTTPMTPKKQMTPSGTSFSQSGKRTRSSFRERIAGLQQQLQVKKGGSSMLLVTPLKSARQTLAEFNNKPVQAEDFDQDQNEAKKDPQVQDEPEVVAIEARGEPRLTKRQQLRVSLQSNRYGTSAIAAMSSPTLRLKSPVGSPTLSRKSRGSNVSLISKRMYSPSAVQEDSESKTQTKMPESASVSKLSDLRTAFTCNQAGKALNSRVLSPSTIPRSGGSSGLAGQARTFARGIRSPHRRSDASQSFLMSNGPKGSGFALRGPSNAHQESIRHQLKSPYENRDVHLGGLSEGTAFEESPGHTTASSSRLKGTKTSAFSKASGVRPSKLMRPQTISTAVIQASEPSTRSSLKRPLQAHKPQFGTRPAPMKSTRPEQPDPVRHGTQAANPQVRSSIAISALKEEIYELGTEEMEITEDVPGYMRPTTQSRLLTSQEFSPASLSQVGSDKKRMIFGKAGPFPPPLANAEQIAKRPSAASPIPTAKLAHPRSRCQPALGGSESNPQAMLSQIVPSRTDGKEILGNQRARGTLSPQPQTRRQPPPHPGYGASGAPKINSPNRLYSPPTKRPLKMAPKQQKPAHHQQAPVQDFSCLRGATGCFDIRSILQRINGAEIEVLQHIEENLESLTQVSLSRATELEQFDFYFALFKAWNENTTLGAKLASCCLHLDCEGVLGERFFIRTFIKKYQDDQPNLLKVLALLPEGKATQSFVSSLLVDLLQDENEPVGKLKMLKILMDWATPEHLNNLKASTQVSLIQTIASIPREDLKNSLTFSIHKFTLANLPEFKRAHISHWKQGLFGTQEEIETFNASPGIPAEESDIMFTGSLGCKNGCPHVTEPFDSSLSKDYEETQTGPYEGFIALQKTKKASARQISRQSTKPPQNDHHDQLKAQNQQPTPDKTGSKQGARVQSREQAVAAHVTLKTRENLLPDTDLLGQEPTLLVRAPAGFRSGPETKAAKPHQRIIQEEHHLMAQQTDPSSEPLTTVETVIEAVEPLIEVRSSKLIEGKKEEAQQAST